MQEPGSEPSSPPARLTFPDLPRLELDELLRQLIDRAQEVISTQGRLRGLLRANQLVTGDLTVETVLDRILTAACELIGARYAALGMLDAEHGLAAFVHTGMPEDAVRVIGHLPEGKGLLGALIDDPRPIRLGRIGEDPRSIGFPPGHPEMNSFLGVPIEVRGEVFGNLYLTESLNGEFSAEDQELAQSLAATAGAAIANARLYETARLRGEWLQASERISRTLLSGAVDPESPLRLVAELAQKVAQAELVTVTVPGREPDDLTVAVAVGAASARVQGRTLPRAETIAGQVMRDGKPVCVAHPRELALETVVSRDIDAGPVMVVPLTGSARAHGVLGVARARGRAAFTDEDLELVSSFAAQAAVAVELADARVAQQRAALADDRERIAEDLHDHVIQKLFAAGMLLQAVSAALPPGRETDRVLGVIDDLDDTIGQIRTTIFQLQRTRPGQRPGMRSRLLDVVSEAAPSLGLEPEVRFAGVIDTLRGDVADDLVAVLREALSNVGRHANATSVEVSLTVRPDRVLLDVQDDGNGPPTDGAAGGGLVNMRRRAERHGGTVTFGVGDRGGAWLRWSVPQR
jgi:two-component system, NarL family, sensor histidine kinase DevS